MGMDTSSSASEDRAGGGEGVATGNEVRVGAGEDGTAMAVGCGDGVTVRASEGSSAVCVGRGCLTEQPTMRFSPIATISTMRRRRVLDTIRVDRHFIFIVYLFRAWGGY